MPVNIEQQIRDLIHDIKGEKMYSSESYEVLIEKFLFFIHIRKKKLAQHYKDRAYNILLFLFKNTKDIRFFNEALWLCNKRIDAKKKLKLYEELIKNLPEKNNYRNNHQAYIFKWNHLKKLEGKNIAFIGIPFYFIKVVKFLKKNRIDSTIIFINYHPNKIIRYFLHFDLFNKFFCKVIFPGTKIQYHKVSSHRQLKTVILDKDYDIGFHKIPGIIPENIFGRFSDGLLNDHWGLLPELKGRSTIYYSILLNIPVIVTNHFIEKNIDAGHIVNYSKIKVNKRWFIITKFNVYWTLSSRIINSLCSYYSNNGPIKVNSSQLGKIYYEMHPVLKRYIMINCLNEYSY